MIMIGEIRDLETAEIAVQASLTGHLVLATLHTNDAASAVTRLADMGVEPYLLASSLLGVLAQRLVRTLCPACRVPVAPDEASSPLLARQGLPARRFSTARGCAACNQPGIAGAPASTSSWSSTTSCAVRSTTATARMRCGPPCARSAPRRLRDDGARWVADGTTSLDELVRVTRDSGGGKGMPGFRYQAYSIEGRLHKGVLEADSARQARSLLRDQGLTPYRVEVIAANDPGGGRHFRAISLSPPPSSRASRGASPPSSRPGSPSSRPSTRSSSRPSRSASGRCSPRCGARWCGGSTIAKALGAFPGVFPELYRTLVAAGEASGQLHARAHEACRLPRGAQQLRGRISLALVYPPS